MWKAMHEHFPDRVAVHYSKGGYFLWVECPEEVDTTLLYQWALKENIGIAPGKMFSINQQFNHCFRINASFEYTSRIEKAVKTLGQLIQRFLDA